MITRFFQYIIKSDNVIIPEIKESNKRRWPMVLALVLLLISAAAIIATLLYQLKHKGLYINDFILFLFILHYNLNNSLNSVSDKRLRSNKSMHTKEHDASSLYQFSFFFCNNVMMKLHFFLLLFSRNR